MTTWYEVEQDIQRWAKDDWLAGYYDADSADEWAHETADGCEYTIYYHHQNALWADSPYVQSFEDMVFGVEDIQQRIQACVYYAIQEVCLKAASEVILSDGVPTLAREERHIYVDRESASYVVKIPVLTIEHTNPNK